MYSEARATVYVWDEYSQLAIEQYNESTVNVINGDVKMVREFDAPSLNIHLDSHPIYQTVTDTTNVVDGINTSFTISNESSVKVIPENHTESAVNVYNGSVLNYIEFTDSQSVNVISYAGKQQPSFSIILVNVPDEKFTFNQVSSINSIPLRHCCDLPGISTVNVINESTSIGVHESATVFVRDLRPDYLRLIGDCASNLSGISGEIPEIDIPVRIGEYQTILNIPDSSEEEIETVYNRPFGIKNDNKKIHGVYISTEPVTITIKLKSGKYIKVNLKPYRSMMIEKLFED